MVVQITQDSRRQKLGVHDAPARRVLLMHCLSTGELAVRRARALDSHRLWKVGDCASIACSAHSLISGLLRDVFFLDEDPVHVLVRAAGKERVLKRIHVARRPEHPRLRAGDRLAPVRADTKLMLVLEVRLVVDEAPAVLRKPVAELVVVEGQRIRVLAMAVRHGLEVLLAPEIHSGLKSKCRQQEPTLRPKAMEQRIQSVYWFGSWQDWNTKRLKKKSWRKGSVVIFKCM